jgi:hypothetical protein
MNRNVYITIDKSSNIDNYTTISINEVSSLVNGYVSNIVCECLDQIEYKARSLVLNDIISKIAFEGSATFKFLNGSVLASKIIRNDIDSQKISSYITNAKSIWTESKILQVFNSFANIMIQKNYIENIYTVLVVTKQL